MQCFTTQYNAIKNNYNTLQYNCAALLYNCIIVYLYIWYALSKRAWSSCSWSYAVNASEEVRIHTPRLTRRALWPICRCVLCCDLWPTEQHRRLICICVKGSFNIMTSSILFVDLVRGFREGVWLYQPDILKEPDTIGSRRRLRHFLLKDYANLHGYWFISLMQILQFHSHHGFLHFYGRPKCCELAKCWVCASEFEVQHSTTSYRI